MMEVTGVVLIRSGMRSSSLLFAKVLLTQHRTASSSVIYANVAALLSFAARSAQLPTPKKLKFESYTECI
jgi:hypothetical protein